MPVIKSAKKKLRKDKKVQKRNMLTRSVFENAIKIARKNPTAEKIRKAYSLVDKAAKSKIIHKNKAARIKSSLSKLIKPVKKTTMKPTKISKKTTASKGKK
jgi:small subunit ribosomal protein S20